MRRSIFRGVQRWGFKMTLSGCIFMQAMFIPAVGILGNDFDRILLICIGSVIWGGMSVGFGFARDLKQVGRACILNSKHYGSCMHLRYQRWSS